MKLVENTCITYYCKNQRIFFNNNPPESLPIIFIEHIFTQISKILTHFRDRGREICFLTHSVILLKFVARQNYFNQNFCLKNTFSKTCNKMHFPILNFKVAAHLTSRGALRSSISISTDDFLKKWIHIFFLLFDPSCISRDIWLVWSFFFFYTGI